MKKSMKYRLKIGKKVGIIEYDTKEEALKRAEYFKAHGKKVKVISNKELFD